MFLIWLGNSFQRQTIRLATPTKKTHTHIIYIYIYIYIYTNWLRYIVFEICLDITNLGFVKWYRVLVRFQFLFNGISTSVGHLRVRTQNCTRWWGFSSRSVRNVVVSYVVFCGISTFAGYLILNPFYIYTICKR